MRNLIICLSFCIYFNVYSQRSYNINILIEDNQDVQKTETQNDSIVLQTFKLDSQLKLETRKIEVDNSGKLISKVNVKSSNDATSFFLIYQNKNSTNNPDIVDKKSTSLLMKYPTDFKNTNLESIIKLLKNATDIYLIETEKQLGYYMRKKVYLKAF